jgi:sugar (pentulose or hexulose) kinase
MTSETDVVLVVDIGTGSGRAALVDRAASIRLQAGHRHSLSPGADGSGAFDAEALLRAMADDVATVLEQGRAAGLRVAGACVTSVRGAFVVLDARGEPVWSTGSLDDRATAELEALLPDEPAFHEATGQRLAFAAVPRLRGLARRDPATWARARRLLTLDAWVTRWLTGVDAIAAPSAAPTGALRRDTPAWLETSTQSWRPTEGERALLPPVAVSGATIGHTRGLDPLGLKDGIPVAAGGGDAQLAALGLGCVAPGDTAVVMGSHWQTIVVTDRPATLPAPGRLIQAPQPGLWHADTVTMRVGLELDGVWPDASADDAAGAPWRRALEGGCARVAAALAGMVESQPGVPRPSVVHVGGGASRDPRVRDALATALGRPVRASATHEASVLGAAMCAAVAAGWADDPGDAARQMHAAPTTPDRSTSTAATREA